jgi:SPP1 family predicted phage head-tail adaptor
MRAGKLRSLLTIQQRSTTQDNTTGDIVQPWTALYSNLPAHEMPEDSREIWNGDRVESQPIFKFRIRYASGITPSMRAVIGSRVFTITSVRNTDGRNRELILVCTEVLN